MIGTGALAMRVSDRGEASTQFVVLVPVLFVLALLVVQSALWFHTANMAESAAAQGAAAGAPLGAALGAAGDEAARVVDENGGRLIGSPAVSVGADQVVVAVEVAVPHLVPFFPETVRRTQSEPRERFVPEPER